MSIPGAASPLLLAGAAEAFGRSLRFNSSDSAYLSRTPSSAGNRKTWTWAGWVKRSDISGRTQTIFGIAGEAFWIGSGSNADFYFYGAGTYYRGSTQHFRDPSAWFHLLVAWDSSNATAQDRLRIWINGAEITSWSVNNTVALNQELSINTAVQHLIGQNQSTNHFSGYLADIYFIDGQALDPTSFGEFDDNGIWQPVAYTGTYGTNGFHLDFSDNSTAAALGTDNSGNNNTWTVNNISVTAGAGNDSLVDFPTNGTETDTGSGGEVRGNYCTLNPLNKGSALVLSEGNLQVTGTTNAYNCVFGTIGVSSGKWYWEQTLQAVVSQDIQLGIVNKDVPLNSYPGSTSRSYGFSSNDSKWNNSTSSAYTTSWVSGDIIGLAFDADAGTLTLYRNGSSLGTAFSSIPADTYFPVAGAYNSSSTSVLNFGQRPFAYTAPSGFKALCTTNLANPTIADGSTAFDALPYSGNGQSSQAITGYSFSPSFLWIKERSSTSDHGLWNTVVGTSKYLLTDTNDSEFTTSTELSSIDSNGFTVGSSGMTNQSSQTYIAWAWDAGSSTVSNTDGSITSSVRANASAGFSIVTYSGDNSTSGSVGHGLNASPGMVIIKQRNGTKNWKVAHTSLASTHMMTLNETYATGAASWNGVTSSVFYPARSGDTYNNTSGENYVAYCFAPVEGYSAFGSYEGNGSTDGPFVYTGFRSRWLLIKASSASGSHWILIDSARDTYNQTVNQLYANLSNAEGSGSSVDILSNGFKPRADSFNNINGSGITYIYAAFAESPFQYARAR